MADSRITEFTKSLEQNPASTVYARLADMYRQSGEVTKAIEICQQGLERNPSYITGHLILGRCYLERGVTDKAQESFEQALRLDPRNLLSLKMLGDILISQGRKKEGVQRYAQILALDPLDSSIHELYERYNGYELLGEPDDVVSLSQQVEAAMAGTGAEPAPEIEPVAVDEPAEKADSGLGSLDDLTAQTVQGAAVMEESKPKAMEETPALQLNELGEEELIVPDTVPTEGSLDEVILDLASHRAPAAPAAPLDRDVEELLLNTFAESDAAPGPMAAAEPAAAKIPVPDPASEIPDFSPVPAAQPEQSNEVPAPVPPKTESEDLPVTDMGIESVPVSLAAEEPIAPEAPVPDPASETPDFPPAPEAQPEQSNEDPAQDPPEKEWKEPDAFQEPDPAAAEQDAAHESETAHIPEWALTDDQIAEQTAEAKPPDTAAPADLSAGQNEIPPETQTGAGEPDPVPATSTKEGDLPGDKVASEQNDLVDAESLDDTALNTDQDQLTDFYNVAGGSAETEEIDSAALEGMDKVALEESLENDEKQEDSEIRPETGDKESLAQAGAETPAQTMRAANEPARLEPGRAAADSALPEQPVIDSGEASSVNADLIAEDNPIQDGEAWKDDGPVSEFYNVTGGSAEAEEIDSTSMENIDKIDLDESLKDEAEEEPQADLAVAGSLEESEPPTPEAATEAFTAPGKSPVSGAHDLIAETPAGEETQEKDNAPVPEVYNVAGGSAESGSADGKELEGMDRITLDEPLEAEASGSGDEPKADAPVSASQAAEEAKPERLRIEIPEGVASATLAELFLRQGQKDQALEVYRFLLRRDPSSYRLASRLREIEMGLAQSEPEPQQPRQPQSRRDFTRKRRRPRPDKNTADPLSGL